MNYKEITIKIPLNEFTGKPMVDYWSAMEMFDSELLGMFYKSYKKNESHISRAANLNRATVSNKLIIAGLKRGVIRGSGLRAKKIKQRVDNRQ